MKKRIGCFVLALVLLVLFPVAVSAHSVPITTESRSYGTHTTGLACCHMFTEIGCYPNDNNAYSTQVKPCTQHSGCVMTYTYFYGVGRCDECGASTNMATYHLHYTAHSVLSGSFDVCPW